MKAREGFLPWEVLEGKLSELKAVLDGNDPHAIRRVMAELVSGYRPEGEIVDWVHLAQEDAA
jgi:hypothetical protein